MAATELQPLLSHARLVARYAVENSQVPAGTRIFQLLAAIGASDAPDRQQSLAAELGDALKQVAFAEGHSLKSWHRREAFVDWAFRVLGMSPAILLGLFTMLVTLYLAFQSSQLHQADMALRAYDEWMTQQPREKIFTAFKMYRYEKVLKVDKPPLAQLDAYQKQLEDALQLVSKETAIQQLLHNASQLLRVPELLAEPHTAVGPPPGAVEHPQGKPGDDFAKDLPGPDCVAFALGSTSNQGAPSGCNADAVRAGLAALPAAASGSGAPAMPDTEDVKTYRGVWNSFLKEQGINPTTFAYPPWPIIYATRSKVNMLANWLLPALYGVLGACVFLMRDMMQSRAERTRPDGSLLVSILLRITLGAVAGLIVGWISVPGPGSGGAVATGVSSIPFGAAFLAGFSIESLFAKLDQIGKPDLKVPAK